MQYDKNNIFAKIIRGDLPSEVIYEDDEILAFNDIAKAAPIHVLVIPKAEFIDFDDFIANSSPEKISSFFQIVAKIAKNLNLNNNNYRLITNKGEEAAQTVKHFHVHILGGKKLNEKLS
jgi:histidine triad (HIT) family protein